MMSLELWTGARTLPPVNVSFSLNSSIIADLKCNWLGFVDPGGKRGELMNLVNTLRERSQMTSP